MDEDAGDSLDKLAVEIADGISVDWEAIGRLPEDDPRRRFVEHLRVVAAIAEHHRSAVAELTEQITTEPGPDQRARIGHVRSAGGTVDGETVVRWGHLILRRRIGAGAFGEVFHAHDVWLDHPVALKLLKPEIAKSDFSNRILHEAQRLARVRHPNVVNVHGADMHDGRIGFWMDLIDGETLSELVARGRLSHGEAAHVGREICLALAAVHGANLVHRDVKAQNVMRAFNGGRIILMDFGAGEFMNQPTAGRRMQGTPLYLAPELFEHAVASVASDVYAVGVLLFHLVTKEFPVTGTSLNELADAHRRGERRRLRDERPDLPATFVSVVERATATDPKARFKSAGEMYAALGGEERAKYEATGQPTGRQKIARAVVAIVAAHLLVLMIGFAASSAFENVLHIDRAFGSGNYLFVGIRAIYPFVILWTVVAAIAAVVTWLGVRLGPVRRAIIALDERIEPSTQASLLIWAAAAGLLWSTWWFSEVYSALISLALDPRPADLDLSILGWKGRDIHRIHAMVSSALTFILGIAMWLWFPGLERRSANPARIRRLRAGLMMVFLVVAKESITRPFLWDTREIVAFKKQRSFVVGSNKDELLLFNPEKGQRTYQRVSLHDPELQRNVDSRQLFLEPIGPDPR